MPFWKRTKGAFEWAEHVHFAHALIAQWSAVMSAAIALGAGYWAWLTQWGYLPIALTGLGVFTASIWSINGVLWLRGQKRPTRARVTYDYSWGLGIEGVQPSLDVGNELNTLELRLILRNCVEGPLKFEPEKIEFKLGDRYVTAAPIGAVIAKGSSLTLFPGNGFKKKAWDEFPERFVGTIEYTIRYGHPEFGMMRKAYKLLHADFFKREGGLSLNWRIISETDNDLS